MRKFLFFIGLVLFNFLVLAQTPTPIASYPFTGNANDAIGTNHGTVNGATLTTDRFGNANSAYSFDGVDDFIGTANIATNQTDNWTMTAWVKPATTAQNNGTIVLNGFDNGITGNGYAMVMGDATNSAMGDLFKGLLSGVVFVNSGLVFSSTNEWYHTSIVREAGITKLYFNGVLSGMSISNNPNTPSGNLTIGSATGIRFFNGCIDDIQVYNTALSGTQIATEFAGNGGPIVSYPFTGNANDAISTNHGTVNGATLTTDRFGNANSAYSFDGVNDYIEVADNNLIDLSTNFTISAWIFPTVNSAIGTIINKEYSYEISRHPDGTIQYALSANGTGSDWAWVNTNLVAPLNTWSYITFVKSGSNVQVYLNAVNGYTNSSQPATLASNTSNLRIGERTFTSEVFHGKLDDIKIYNTALSPSQVLNEYNTSSNNLVAYYPFNANANDTIGTNHGTVNGATLTADRFGNANSAYSFDGIDDFIELGNINFANNDYTISFWVNLNSTTTDNTVFSGANPSVLTNTFILSELNNGVGRFLHRNPAGNIGGVDLSGVQSFPSNSWKFVSCVKQGSTLSYYVNGVLDNSVTNVAATNISSAIFVELGRLRNGANSFIRYLNGKLDEVKIYNTALSASQVAAEYTPGPSLIASYTFSNNTNDGSGNNLHGTIIGSPTFTTDRKGNANSAILFNGNVANRVEVDNNILLHTPSITIASWVKFNSLAGSHQGVVDKPLGTNVSDSWHFGTQGSNFSVWHMNSGTNFNPYSQVTAPIVTGQWYYAVNTFDNTTKQHKLYIDGVLKMTNTFNSTIGYDNNKMYIGAAFENNTLDFPMNGVIDEVKIYGEALSQQQIQNEFINQISFNTKGSGNAISFDGNDDYVQLPPVLDGATQFSIDFWVKTTENRVGGAYWQHPTILGNANPSSPDGDFGIVTNNGQLAVWHGLCCGDQSLQTTKVINDNQWHHIAVVNNGSTMVLYADGILLPGSIPTNNGAIQNSARPWRIGMNNSCCIGNWPFAGTIDEVRFWNNALTETQIRERMCRKLTNNDALYSNLVGYFNFDESDGSSALDGSNNSNLSALFNGASHVASGAPIGNTSSFSYAGAASSVNHANPTLGDDITATLTAGGADGIQVYHVNEAPNSVVGVSGLETANTYFGTFVVGGTSPTYSITYNYDGIAGITNENGLVLATRASNSVNTWNGVVANLNTTANTLSVTSINNSQAEYRVAALDAGLVSSNQANCFSFTPNPLTATPAFNNNPATTYQWQDSTVGGTWQNISGATTMGSLVLPLAISITYYRRLATLSGTTIPSNEVSIEAYNAINPSTYPINEWNFYAYDGASVDSVGITFKGSYTRSALGINTVTDYGSGNNPSTASGYAGCTLVAPGNIYSLYAKRQGFPTGPYSLVVNQHDDNLKILKDGVVIVTGACCNNLGSAIFTLGTLDASTKIECRVANTGGPGHLQITLQPQTLDPGTISGAQTICINETPSAITNTSLAFGGSTTTITYQWQQSTVANVWTNISGATSSQYQPPALSQTTSFRRVATNDAEVLNSNEIVVTVNTVQGNPSVFGSNQWNVYAYNGASDFELGASEIYRGFYTSTNLNIKTDDQWPSHLSPSQAANYQGCPVNTDNFMWVMKRQGFPTGNYYMDIPTHDDFIRVYKNGVQVFEHLSCCDAHSAIPLGNMDATTNIEVRCLDGTSTAIAVVNFISNLQGGTIGSNQVFCNTTSTPNLFTSIFDAYGGLTTITYQWQDSIAGGTWQNISGANATTFQAPIVTQDIYYRRKASNLASEIAYSNQIFMDFQGVLFYQDSDGDGFGNPAIAQLACTVPVGFVNNNSDCDDNDILERPNQIWYIDADADGYSKGSAIQQCTRPLNGFVASELTAINSDCNDNNSHIHPGAQYITYTGAPNYTNNIVYPLTGDPFTNYHYEVMYYNIYNELPENGAPRLSVDFNQDFVLDLIDKRVSMLPDDVNDVNTQDGKKYYMDITGLQPGIPIQSYVSPHLINCDYFGPFTQSPQVLTSPNLSILAQDITFSNYTPGVSSPMTVSASIKNESDFQATNFTVKLVNMFDTSISYPLNTVSFVPAHSNTIVTWNITTPSIASLCPMKVIIDFNNTIPETNEFDNVAIRGFANGGGSAQGGISVITQVSPSTIYISPGQIGTVNLTGQATYTGLANPLINASVSGAEVACTIVETGQTFIGNTDAQGNFSVPITTPVGFGVYHISGTVYDFTWTGSFSGTNNPFEVIDAVVVQGSNLPQLQPNVNVPNTSLLIGNSITVNYAASNAGTADATLPFKTKLLITGPSNFLVLDSFTTTLLNMGATSNTTTVTTGMINTPGTYYVTVTTDVDESVTESAENDNSLTLAITVLAPEVDLVPEVASTPLVVCSSQIVVSSSIHNAGSIPSNSSHAVIRLKENGLVIDTALISVAVINANETFPISHTFTPVFSQHNFTIEVVADRFNTHIESSELNNLSTVQLFVDTCKPNLKMADECQAVSVDALNNDYTGPVTLSALITNTGDRKLEQALTVRFDFMNGTFYDQVLNTPLEVNHSITVQTTIPSMPLSASHVKVIIDPIDAVVEKNETDNESSIKALGRDYSPASTGCSPTISQYSYHVGGFFHIYSPILSNTLFKSDSLLVNFKISGPGISGLQNLGNAMMYNVNPTCVCPAVASIPTVHLISQQGLYHIYVTTDPNNDILETDETNNVLDIAILVQDKADMVMTSSYINPSNLNPIAGQSITTQVTYENIGNENLSDQMKLKLIIDNVAVDSISNASGLIQYGKATVNFSTPWASIQPGVHLIRAIIDADNIIDELNETNNESVRPIIVGDAANMHFASLTASHLYPSLNDSITIMANVANNGTLNCSSQVNFYFTNNLNDTIAFKSIPVTVLGNSNAPISFKWGVLDEQTTIVAVIKNSSTQEFDYSDNDSSFQLGKMKLIFEAEPACLSGNVGTLYAGILGGNAPYTYQWSTGTSGNTLQDTAGTYSVIVTDATGQTSSGESSIMGCLVTVQLKCFLQGYYLGSLNMADVLFHQGRINLHTHTDTVTVELRNTTTLAVEYTVNGMLKTDGTLKAFFPLEALGNNYYVVIKHRNSMETWSAVPLSITTVTPYDFTTAASKAYGDNQLEIEPGVFGLFTGDINQDGFIDSFDFPALDNDIFNGVNTEYVNTDLNGDGFVDSFDFPLFDANNYYGVSVITP